MKNSILLTATALACVVAGTAARGFQGGYPIKWEGAIFEQGDPDGRGSGEIGIVHGHARLCFRLVVSNIEAATAAHIHRGAEGIAGPVVVDLTPPPTLGSSSGCVSRVGGNVTHDILTDPDGFYLDVHNAPFPDGALRGQLTRSGN